MKKIRIFLRAYNGWPYWRVTYPDGKRTHRLHWREAKGLQECFGGKLWIDYTIKYDL